MRALSNADLMHVSGAGEDVWYNIGHAVGEAYVAAVDATADLFCAVDEMIGGELGD